MDNVNFREFIKCKRDPMHFIFGTHPDGYRYCLTTDPLGGYTKQPFPDLPYLRFLVDLYVKEDLIIVAKSRQMMMTWIGCALLLWQVMFNEAQKVIIQCLKEENANSHIQEKVNVLWQNLPTWLKTQKPAKCIKNHFTIMHEENNAGSDSVIKALQQGADAIRQFTASIIFSDEMAFQDQAKDAYTTSMPTVMGRGKKRGKYIGVSTPNHKNFFYRLWDGGNQDWEDVSAGVRLKKNKSGFAAVALHYSADPQKDQEWVNEVQKTYEGTLEDWEREYEINFSVSGGQKYFPEYTVAIHEKKDIDPVVGRPLLRSWDFGYRNPACVVTQLNTQDQWLFLWEKLGADINIHDFIKMVKEECFVTFPEHHQRTNHEDISDYIDYCDVAGRAKNPQTDISDIQVLNDNFIYPINHKFPISLGLKMIRRFLLLREDMTPNLFIDVDKCPLLAEGFRGAFHFKEDRDGQLKEELFASDNDSVHLFDAAKYIACNHPYISQILTTHGTDPRLQDDPKKMTPNELKSHDYKRIIQGGGVARYPVKHRRLSL